MPYNSLKGETISVIVAVHMRFTDRKDAALRLSERLQKMDLERPLFLAIPRGGVPLGRTIVDRIGGDLDLMLVKKIGHPWNPEFAIASVTEEGELILGESAEKYGFSPEDLAEESRKTIASLRLRRRRYTQGRPSPNPEGRSVILVDDGVATGLTVIAAIQALQKKKAREILVATPVVTRQALQKIQEAGATVVALTVPENFLSVSQVYLDFREVSDEEVIELLDMDSKGGPHASF